jgi:hypothetical protein
MLIKRVLKLAQLNHFLNFINKCSPFKSIMIPMGLWSTIKNADVSFEAFGNPIGDFVALLTPDVD